MSILFSTAYEAYCGELKTRLDEMKLENEVLKRTADANALELLSAMTSLCIHCTNSGALQRYSCNVMEGALKGNFVLRIAVCHNNASLIIGHIFVLTLDQHTREYTYNPDGSPVKNLKQIAADFSCVIIFPEHMLTRFLINLLHVSYINQDSS